MHRALPAALFVAVLWSGCLPRACSPGEDPALGHPASWAWQMEHMSVDPDSGRRWEMDQDWVMRQASVPTPLMLPDGRFGMFYSHMRLMGERPLLVSDDGLVWEDEPLSKWPVEVFPQYCGNRLEDVAPWIQAPDVYRLVFMGHFDPLYKWGDPPPDDNHATRLCHAQTRDLKSYEASDSYLWEGTKHEQDNSVFSVLSTSSGEGLFFYNGDLGGGTRAGTGIRAIAVDAQTLAVRQVFSDPIELDTIVDPHAVFLDGGGIRLYATSLGDHPDGIVPGVVFQDFDEKLRPKGRLKQAVVSPGNCRVEGDWGCGCVLDPAVIRLKDGRMVMYAGFLEEDGQEVCSLNIRRFFAVD